MLIEAADPMVAAMLAYRLFEDSTPTKFDVVGPDTEIDGIALSRERQEEAITIAFGG